MKAIIVDDEPDGIKILEKLLATHCPSVKVVASCSNAFIAKKQIDDLKPNVVFLDIQMPNKTGLEMLAEIANKHFEVIFVTAHNEYLLEALQFSAVDYLLKPVDEDRLIEAVARVEKRMHHENETKRIETLLHNMGKTVSPLEMKLCIPTIKGFSIIAVSSIMYCEAERGYTIFHLDDGKTVTSSKSLTTYEDLLSSITFLRIHKSFLINLLHVKEYQRGEGGVVMMSNGAEIEVSRRKKELFLAKIKEVFKG